MFFIVSVLISCNNTIINENKPNTIYDTKIPTGTVFKDSNESKNFTYESTVIVNALEGNDTYQSLQYRVKITPKTDSIYENV